MKKISASSLKKLLRSGQEIALLDVREHGQYGACHLFFAVSIPYSLLEYRVRELVPNLHTPIVFYTNAQQHQLMQQVSERLKSLAYDNVAVLEGGIEAWQEADYNTFAGVNLPSKTFGELAELKYRTPHLSAQQLHALMNDPSAKLLILDGRPLAEYQKMNIPGAICCPNGELALRATQMVADESTTIVINCAGRTRSIIGAQSLINFGIKNPVYALENGTQGWYLEDFKLEHGATRQYPEAIDSSLQSALQVKGQALQQRFELPTITLEDLINLLASEQSTTYVCDIRTQEEFKRAAWPSIVRHTPGGQLIQATDEFIGVRNANLVLIDTDGIRAPVVASWLKQLGWSVYLLPLSEGTKDLSKRLPERPSVELVLRHSTEIAAEALEDFIQQHVDLLIADTRNSMDFKKQHLNNAIWLNRSHLLHQHELLQPLFNAPKSQAILLMGDNQAKNRLLAADLAHLGFKHLYLVQIEPKFFANTHHALSQDDALLSEADCIDYLFFLHDRHQYNKAAARQYLKWETDLISKTDEDEKAVFNFSYAKPHSN